MPEVDAVTRARLASSRNVNFTPAQRNAANALVNVLLIRNQAWAATAARLMSIVANSSGQITILPERRLQAHICAEFLVEQSPGAAAIQALRDVAG